MPSNTANAVIVSYDSTGVAQWARSVSSGDGASIFQAVTTSGGFAYAAGSQHGSGSYTYSGATASGAANSLGNALIVKFSISTGAGQWARSTSNGSGGSGFRGIATDTSGNIYACGHQAGNVPYTYGSGVTATATWNYNNLALVKYNASGTAQWARTANAANSDSFGYATATDTSGNVFVVGYQYGKGNFDFGDGVIVSGASSLGNALILKYNPQGNAVQAQTVSTGGNWSIFYGLNIRATYISAVGYQTGNGVYTYGANAAANGSAVGTNSVLVRYE